MLKHEQENSHGYPVIRYEAPDTLKCKEVSYDLVVLSHGIVPNEESSRMAQLFDLGIAANGFFDEGTPVGVYPAGACLYPMRSEECVEDASRVSQQVLCHLGKGM